MGIYAKIDCGLPRDPKLMAAGPLARLVYIQFVLYCRENLTDGVLDAVLVPLVAPDIPSAKKHLAALVGVGALDEVENGWRIPPDVWARWNPTKAEVDEMRRAAAERKASWRDRQKRDADVPAGHDRSRRSRDGQREGEGETEGKREHDSVNPQQQQTRGPARLAAEQRTSILKDVAVIVADARDLRGRGNNPAAYFASAVTGITTEIHDQVHDLLTEHPDWDAESVARQILYPPRPSAFPAHWKNTLSGTVRAEDYV